jgi:hypothetical protein
MSVLASIEAILPSWSHDAGCNEPFTIGISGLGAGTAGKFGVLTVSILSLRFKVCDEEGKDFTLFAEL